MVSSGDVPSDFNLASFFVRPYFRVFQHNPRNPADTAAAEQSLLTAVAIAQSQKARSFELRAALSLAKLYRAANRDADAHAVLAPAVEGFLPDPTIPRTHRGASPSLGAKPVDRLASIRYRLWLAIATVNASAKSPGPLSLWQQHYRLYRSARNGVSRGAVEVGKIVTRDEPVERHPARQEKIDEN